MLSVNLWIEAFVAAIVVEYCLRLLRRSVSILAQAVKTRVIVAVSALAVSLLTRETGSGRFGIEQFISANYLVGQAAWIDSTGRIS